MHDQVYGPAVVLHIDPIPDVHPIPINRKGVVLQGIADHQGDQFLRKLVGPIVIGAPGDDGGQAIGFIVGPHQQICCRLAGRIGTVGREGRDLGEGPRWSEGTINLIGRNLDEL